MCFYSTRRRRRRRLDGGMSESILRGRVVGQFQICQYGESIVAERCLASVGCRCNCLFCFRLPLKTGIVPYQTLALLDKENFELAPRAEDLFLIYKFTLVNCSERVKLVTLRCCTSYIGELNIFPARVEASCHGYEVRCICLWVRDHFGSKKSFDTRFLVAQYTIKLA